MNKKKILLVDDDINVLNSLSVILDKEFELLTAANGVRAINFFSTQNIDLIVLDINIPDINGETLITVLERNEKWKHIPVIVLSGYKKPSYDLPENVKYCFGKPVSQEDLMHAIKQFC